MKLVPMVFLMVSQFAAGTTVATLIEGDGSTTNRANIAVHSPTSLLAKMKDKKIPAVGIGWVEDGVRTNLVVGNVYGRKVANANTIWNVASLTKPITAMIALKLVDAGQLSLDEPVSNHYTDPDLLDDPRHHRLTLRHLLSHQAGFPNWRYSDPDKKLRFMHAPGEAYHYSGEGYDYVRKLVEHKLGKDFNTIARSILFDPLGMNDTSFVWNEKLDLRRVARWHRTNLKTYPIEKNQGANGADNLMTTIGDYTKFVSHILDGAGLSSALLQDMMRDHVRVGARKHFGLGWCVDEGIDGADKIALVHSGSDNGVRTIAFLVPSEKKALIIFTNSDNGTEVYQTLLLHYLKKNGEGILQIEME